nr:hypothetical protein [uncultured Cohaesibacter sp.]
MTDDIHEKKTGQTAGTASFSKTDKPDNRGAISSAFKIESFGTDDVYVQIRGWYSNPSIIKKIEFRDDKNNLIGESSFNEARPDVVKNEKTEGTVLCGFNFVTHSIASEFEIFTVDFVSNEGKVLSRLKGQAVKLADFQLQSMEFDEPTRRLTYVGRFSPSTACRSAAIKTKDKEFPVSNLFESNPDTGTGRFDWFYGSMQPVNPIDVHKLQFIFTLIDGKKYFIDISNVDVIRNPPMLEIEAIQFDYLRNSLHIAGWYRSFSEASHLSFSLGDQTIYCMPTTGFAKRIQDKEHFKGPQPCGWEVSTKIDASLKEPSTILSGERPVLKVTLWEKDNRLIEKKQIVKDENVVWASVDLCLFNQNTSQITLFGRASNILADQVKLSRRGQTIAKIKLHSSFRDLVDPDGFDPWDWFASAEINGRMNPGEVLNLEFFDEKGNSLNKDGAIKSDVPVLLSTAAGFIEGHPRIAELVFSMASHERRSELPLMVLSYPGSMAKHGGGGNTRLRQLLSFVKEIGFQVCLIDRSELWDIASYSDNYSRLMEEVDFHIPLPPSMAKGIANYALEALSD